MSERPTPETDAVAAYEGNWDTKALRMTAHARRLERQRDEEREDYRAKLREMNSRHTPETDAAVISSNGQWSFVLKETCRRIERERDEAREALRTLAEHGENEIQKLIKERDEAREKYFALRDLSNNATELAEKYKRERDELREKYDTLATEYMLEVNKLCNERDEAREELRKLKNTQ